MNAARATSASLRLLLVAIAFVLTNMWLWLKWTITLMCRYSGTKTPMFTLNLFALVTTECIKHIYGALCELKLWTTEARLKLVSYH